MQFKALCRVEAELVSNEFRAGVQRQEVAESPFGESRRSLTFACPSASGHLRGTFQSGLSLRANSFLGRADSARCAALPGACVSLAGKGYMRCCVLTFALKSFLNRA